MEVLLLSEALDLAETSLVGLLELSVGPICENLGLNPRDPAVGSVFLESERLSNDRTPLKATDEEGFGLYFLRKLETEGKGNLEYLWFGKENGKL